MGELSGLYALWYREVKVFLRERSRIVSSIVNPIIWLIAFGGGLGSTISFGGADYQTFIFPGVLMLTVLFTSIFFGLYIVWDKRMDFFKEVMVAPLSRITLFTGKMMGGCTDSLLQGSFLIVIGLFFNIKYTLYSLIVVILFLLFLSAATTSLGLAIGAQMSSFEGFGLIQSFVIMPLFFLSGALYPLENLPAWLLVVTRVNPLTYIVDGMRGALLGLNHFPIWMDLGVALVFMITMILAGTLSFMRMR
ncbi:MAG: ABC transporter permease [Candidatus Methanomethylicaceae archaeon]|nr:ABC transporter permease [Candidatus Verstraetearchaeota archaeon]